MHTEPNSYNVCSLLDICVHKICRLESGPDCKGKNCSCRPNARAKQQSVYDGNHKFHRISYLSLSYPNGMSTVIGLASTRNWDTNILTWSGLDDLLHDLCNSRNLPDYCFYTDRGFLGVWLCIRTPHMVSFPFQLTAR